MTVKDSVQYRSVVVQEHPQRKIRLIAAGVALVLLMFGLGFGVGAPGGYSLYREVAGAKAALDAEVTQLRQRLNKLETQQIQNETRRQINRSALDMVRVELSSQEQKNAELAEAVRFYKSLMAPEEAEQGLNIRLYELAATGDPLRFQYQLVVEQLASKHSIVQGAVRIEVHGERDGKPVTLSLSELGENAGPADIRLRFKYFQAIDGELTLPEGFKPELVKVVALATTPKRKEVKKQFPWRVQERLSHVGQ